MYTPTLEDTRELQTMIEVLETEEELLDDKLYRDMDFQRERSSSNLVLKGYENAYCNVYRF